MSSQSQVAHKDESCKSSRLRMDASGTAPHKHLAGPLRQDMSSSPPGTGKRASWQGGMNLNGEQGEVQSMSAIGGKPFHLSDLLQEDLIFIVFVLKALESKI